MNSKLPEVSDQDLHGRIDEFMSRFKFGTLLNRAGIRKIRGLSPLLVFRSIFDLAFAGGTFTRESCRTPAHQSVKTLCTDSWPLPVITGDGLSRSWPRWLSEA